MMITACAPAGPAAAAPAANNPFVGTPSWAALQDQAIRLARGLAGQQIGMFAAFRDCGVDDLTQEALAAVHKAFPRFDASLASFSTFATLVGGRAILNLHRTRQRDAQRQERKRADAIDAAAIEPDHVQWEPDAPPPETIDGEVVGSSDPALGEPPPLADWLAAMYGNLTRRGRRVGMKPAWNRGRRSFTASQQLTAGLLMRRLKLTCRAAAGLFADRRDLRRAIALAEPVPHKDWFARAAEIAAEYLAALPPRKRRLLLQLVDLPARAG